MIATDNLKAPFPYFGGKRRAVDVVWPCFGTVDNYVEPFCGSVAMLLGAPNVAGRWIRTNNWTDVGGAETETEVITPDYLDGDIIYAINFTFAGSPADLTGLTLLDLNVDGRAWNIGP